MKATIRIDNCGRILLPKKFREAMGIFSRTPAKLEVIEDKIVLRVLPTEGIAQSSN
jgi:bifunctional DNA-binding transcriptional regulator/antitoxin component of YhaV-PrlF toxin-antitoxin module